jgi:hypothetical protein
LPEWASRTRWGEIFAQFDFEGAFVLGDRECVDNVDRVSKEDGLSAQAGGTNLQPGDDENGFQRTAFPVGRQHLKLGSGDFALSG